MYILAIETTGNIGSCAVIGDEGKVLGQKSCVSPMSHLKDLIPMIDKLLKELNIDKNSLSHIAASIGPGSFTGIRIGVSTARALAQSLGINETIPVPTLESFIYNKEAFEIAQGAWQENYVAVPIINARRGQVYGMIEGYLKAGPYLLTEVLQDIKEKVYKDGKIPVFFGDGIQAYEKNIVAELTPQLCQGIEKTPGQAIEKTPGQAIEKTLGQADEGETGSAQCGSAPCDSAQCGSAPYGSAPYIFADENSRYQNSQSVGKWAFDFLKNGGKSQDYENLLPDYMRKAEAEQKLEAGVLPICKGPRQE